jgi:hypothetical protein
MDSKLREAVTKNDSSLISSDSLQLLTKTLSNWGNMVKSFGSTTESDSDDDDDDNGVSQNAAKSEAAGSASDSADDAAADEPNFKSAKEAWTSGEEKEAGNGEGGSPKEEQRDVAGGRSLGGDGDQERQQQATEEAEDGQQVRRVLNYCPAERQGSLAARSVLGVL